MNSVISEPCYKGTILQRNYRKMTFLSGLGNLRNTQSKLSLKCATTLEIGRLANRGSYPTAASRF